MSVRLGLRCLALLALAGQLQAQELYLQTEPASNMAAHVPGLRLTHMGMPVGGYRSRVELEGMYGFSARWMVHVAGFASNFFSAQVRPEAFSLYAKYRFLAHDALHQHFRLAAYGRASASRNPIIYSEMLLAGNNSGLEAGLIATQLVHKLAFSASGGLLQGLNSLGTGSIYQPGRAANYSLSAGYLMLPRHYSSYHTTNLNLYVELLGYSNLAAGGGEPAPRLGSLMDVAPGVQFIFLSKFRLDASYRTQLYSHIDRMTARMWLLRLEYVFFPA